MLFLRLVSFILHTMNKAYKIIRLLKQEKINCFFHLDTHLSSELNARNSKSDPRKTKQRKPNQSKFVIHMTWDEYKNKRAT